MASLIEELRQRRVGRALLAYGAGVAAVLQGTDMVFAALALPDLAYRIIVVVAIAGFPLVATLSWVYDLTAEGLRRTVDISPVEVRAPVPFARYLQLIGAFTVASLIVLATAGAVSQIRYPSSDDGRVGLAIFPLRTTGSTGAEWSEGAADLLATALEGTPSLRIVDPWSLWSSLRPEAGAAARVPDPDEAQTLAEHSGAHRFLLGSVVPSGNGLEVAIRLYRVGRAEPMDAFTVSSTSDGMKEAVRQAAVRVLARVWGPLRPPDLPAELDFDATESPEALKSYLAATEALRRGMIDSANTAIDRSLALDSTFVLAIVEAVLVKSWALSTRGMGFRGFFQLLARAEPFEAALNERSRLRLEATRASVRTDGAAALDATKRILELDPLDYGALASLEYYRRVYGWQLTPPEYGSRALAERVVQIDSTQIPALRVRMGWSVAAGDTADLRVQLGRLSAADTTGDLGRGTLVALRAVLADSAAFAHALPELALLGQTDFVTVVQTLRTIDPPRAALLLETTGSTEGAAMRSLAIGAGLQFDLARGYAARVDSVLRTGASGADAERSRRPIELMMVAADLADLGDRTATERVVASLMAYLPPDSALAYFQTRPVWWGGWLIGAWHAQAGDTSVARRWISALATLPAGGTSEDYRGALQSDIESRLALRRGEEDASLDFARRAMKLWTIHTDNVTEGDASPMMRLNLALRLRSAGQVEEATAVLSSLVPPASWMGFLTARASLEMGEMAAERGDQGAALAHLARALALWEGGGEAAAPWTTRARALADSLESRSVPLR